MGVGWHHLAATTFFLSRSTSSKSSGNLFCKKERQVSPFKRLPKKYELIKYPFAIPHQVFKLQWCSLLIRWIQWGLWINNDSYICWIVYCYERLRHWREHTGKKLDLLLSFVMPNDKIIFLVLYHFHLHLGLKW